VVIGQSLKHLRVQKNMSQGDIEKRTGLLRCYISRVENGHPVPAILTLERMARALGRALSYRCAAFKPSRVGILKSSRITPGLSSKTFLIPSGPSAASPQIVMPSCHYGPVGSSTRAICHIFVNSCNKPLPAIILQGMEANIASCTRRSS